MEPYKSPLPLKLCPFCRSRAELLHEPFEDDPRLNDILDHTFYGDFMICCTNIRCRAFMKRRYYHEEDRDTTAEVIAKRWNTRNGHEPQDDYHYNSEKIGLKASAFNHRKKSGLRPPRKGRIK